MILGMAFIGVVDGIRTYRVDSTPLAKEQFPVRNQPWILENEEGDRAYFVNDKLHRVNGPAIERKDGATFWFVNGQAVQAFPFGEEGKANIASMMEAERQVRI